MFRPQDIKERLTVRPFKPLRIIVSEGQHFDVYHPDLVFVGERDIQVGFPSSYDPRIYDRVTRVALVHIVALEEIPDTPPAGDGQK